MIEVRLTDQDLVSQPWIINSKMTMLYLLKDKGAPIVGTFWLELDPKYDVEMEKGPFETVYRFKEKVI